MNPKYKDRLILDFCNQSFVVRILASLTENVINALISFAFSNRGESLSLQSHQIDEPIFPLFEEPTRHISETGLLHQYMDSFNGNLLQLSSLRRPRGISFWRPERDCFAKATIPGCWRFGSIRVGMGTS